MTMKCESLGKGIAVLAYALAYLLPCAVFAAMAFATGATIKYFQLPAGVWFFLWCAYIFVAVFICVCCYWCVTFVMWFSRRVRDGWLRKRFQGVTERLAHVRITERVRALFCDRGRCCAEDARSEGGETVAGAAAGHSKSHLVAVHFNKPQTTGGQPQDGQPVLTMYTITTSVPPPSYEDVVLDGQAVQVSGVASGSQLSQLSAEATWIRSEWGAENQNNDQEAAAEHYNLRQNPQQLQLNV